MSTIREQQSGLFNVIMYLMAMIAVVGAVAWSWNLIFVLALIVATVPYATWREIQSLEQRNDPARQTIAEDNSESHAQISGRSVTAETKPNGNNRVYYPGIPTTGAIPLKGTAHAPVECGKS
jgi:membrane protein implicated in regulation of membrane protease activity